MSEVILGAWEHKRLPRAYEDSELIAPDAELTRTIEVGTNADLPNEE